MTGADINSDLTHKKIENLCQVGVDFVLQFRNCFS